MLCKLYLTLFGCLFCSLFLFHSSAFAVQQADFSWLPNQEANLTGYKIYYSTVSGQYGQTIDVGDPGVVNGVVQATVTDLVDGTTYYFAATAYDSDGFESDYSQEVVWTSPVEDPITPPPVEEPGPPVAKDMSVYLDEDNTVAGVFDGQSQDGLPLSYHLVSTGSNGTASISDSTSGAFSYTPNANINGIDSFSYKVSDANGESLAATVTVTINSVNDQPEAAVASYTTGEDLSVRGTLFASDIDNDQLIYTVVGNPSHGSVVWTNPSSGAFTYTPDTDVSGSDTFTYVAHDGHVNSNVATVTIVVDPVNDLPNAFDGSLDVHEDEIFSGILQGSDIDSDQLTYSIVSNGYLGKATIIDPADGTYMYTPNEGAYGEDSFEFVISDGSGESNQATVAVTIEQAAPVFAMETGAVSVDGAWTFVAFAEMFREPVVVAKTASSTDLSPCVVRIRNLSPSGFEIRLQNFDYLGEEHGLEQVSYIAMEQGSFTLENGKRVEAGVFQTDLKDYLETKAFKEAFPVIPVVSTSIVTVNGGDTVVSRIDAVTENGFDYRLQEQEANTPSHTYEDVAYIALEPFSGMVGDYVFEIGVSGDEVNDQWQQFVFSQGFDRPPVLLVDMQSYHGADTANLRIAELAATGVQIKVAEEQSFDSEIVHAFESVGLVAVSMVDLNADADMDGLITAEERDYYGTGPGTADTDEDGLDDGREIDFWGDAWGSDADGDGIVNLLDPDSDNDGFLDGEEVDQGYKPADSSSNPDAVVVESPEESGNTVIELEVTIKKERRKTIVELFWSGASGGSVEITRIRDNGRISTVTVANDNYYQERLRKSGTYTYQVCETDAFVCSDMIPVGL